MLITLAVSFGMSILGFQGISNITGPLLEIFYPCLIILIFWALAVKGIFLRKPSQEEVNRSAA
jgi:branched-subunit amino acid permease